jgi:hypothetical protein
MKLKRQYLISELWILAWNASVQHASLYIKGAWKDRREEINNFRNQVVCYVSENLIPRYRERVDGPQHVENIIELINHANNLESGILGENGYKFGVAQKLLNLSLKYYWCLGEVEEPPHCPIDRIVIEKTMFRGSVNWTQITEAAEYLKIIDAVREMARLKGTSIAIWELSKYQRR